MTTTITGLFFIFLPPSLYFHIKCEDIYTFNVFVLSGMPHPHSGTVLYQTSMPGRVFLSANPQSRFPTVERLHHSRFFETHILRIHQDLFRTPFDTRMGLFYCRTKRRYTVDHI